MRSGQAKMNGRIYSEQWIGACSDVEGKSDELNENRIENKRRIKKDARRLQPDRIDVNSMYISILIHLSLQ
jgi:hypothetical protein